jgi:anti-sigma-K factor RskA
MNTSSNEGKNQQPLAGRRSFMRKISVAAGAALAVAASPGHAAADKPNSAAVELTSRQRMLLKYYEQLSDDVQLTIIDMAEEFAGEPALRRASRRHAVEGRAA